MLVFNLLAQVFKACFARTEAKKNSQLGIHVSIFSKVHVTTINSCNFFDKSKKLNKIQQGQVSDRLIDKAGNDQTWVR